MLIGLHILLTPILNIKEAINYIKDKYNHTTTTFVAWSSLYTSRVNLLYSILPMVGTVYAASTWSDGSPVQLILLFMRHK